MNEERASYQVGMKSTCGKWAGRYSGLLSKLPLGVAQAMRMAGHSTADMSPAYTLSDHVAQDNAVRARQEVIPGKTGERLH